MNFKEHTNCRVCGSDKLKPYIDLGKLPLSNNLCNTVYDNPERFPLKVLLCEECGLSQLSIVIDPETLFGHYVYRSSINKGYVNHCRNMAVELKERYNLNSDSFMVDLACFPENNYITTNKGVVDIKDIIVGDMVLSHDTNFHIVSNTFKREVETTFIKLKLKGLNTNTEMTHNHPILTERGWVEAGHLSLDDKIKVLGSTDFYGSEDKIDLYKYLIECHPHEIKLDGDYIVSASNGLKTKLPRFIAKTNEFAKVLGYYVGNGSSGGGSAISIIFNKKYRNKLDEIKSFFKSIFDLEANEWDEENTTTVRFNSRLLSSFFKYVCGHKAKNKKIPFELLNEHNFQSFFYAFWFTDGHKSFSKTKIGSRDKFVYSTSSKRLIVDVWNILYYLGIHSSVQCVRNDRGFSKKDGILYRLTVQRIEDVPKLNTYFENGTIHADSNERFLTIISIEKKIKKDIVYNLTVDESNSYVCNGIVVHNCNDGALLDQFKKEIKLEILGVDPANNLAIICESRNIPIISEFWSEKLASNVLNEYGASDLITATNVFAHVDNIVDFILGAKTLLKQTGVLVMEFPYLLDFIKNNEFDTIYFEHLSYFSISPLNDLCNKCGLTLMDVEKQDIHGGSVRVHIGYGEQNKSVLKFIEKEKEYKTIDPYISFAKSSYNTINEFRNNIAELNKSKYRVAAFAASAKFNTLLNCASITNVNIEYIVDETPEKRYKYSPGTHIPIFPMEALLRNPPDYLVLGSWNFKDELIAKSRQAGYTGKFIIPIPTFKVID